MLGNHNFLRHLQRIVEFFVLSSCELLGHSIERLDQQQSIFAWGSGMTGRSIMTRRAAKPGLSARLVRLTTAQSNTPRAAFTASSAISRLPTDSARTPITASHVYRGVDWRLYGGQRDQSTRLSILAGQPIGTISPGLAIATTIRPSIATTTATASIFTIATIGPALSIRPIFSGGAGRATREQFPVLHGLHIEVR